ncbi:N-acetyl-gamma-glutamyl-phosphate reductase [Pelagicoccus mobilis]|uniref:N-acetyl-gamma-glutamyl-phosphate reductase n=1 Tax=Pelagicoccus mobilis TaxID=415221 RepID=A0A934S5Z3_9BACT|nr:N-acetyl-gamma-glutamyl-phosphate reductase [Pelagicoccus mobilis]MBK1880377.1 N-acetyl-gamma-glutamyl-phosphate reductase [Pelagicoccus mobilis]
MNAAIVGASGYGGEILVKLLAAHPKVTLKAVTSRSQAGKPVSSVIPAMRGVLDDMLFENSDPAELAAREDIDVFFLALPHGAAATYARAIVDAGKKVIDLSADFRIADPATYEEFYGAEHPDVDLLGRAQYVMPELSDDSWKDKDLYACPGCYPTSILVPLLPLVKAGIVSKEHIVANSYSGTSGAGKQSKEAFSYCEVNESAKAYGVPKHRHLSEMEEQLTAAAGEKVIMQFNPHLAPMNRGIATTITVPSNGSTIEQLYAEWEKTYADKPFVTILPSDTRPDTKYVVGTNRVDISAVKDERTGNFVITSAEDNLVKGASGQAIQILNLWQGWDETTGLI